MTQQEQIINWLIIGFQQATERLSEIFYFDKKNNQFFSILVTDYFLFDSDLNLAKDTTSTYSEKTLQTLIDRIKRIENKENNIIAIPRLGKLENDNDFVYQKIDIFLSINEIDINTATIWEVEECGTININLNDTE